MRNRHHLVTAASLRRVSRRQVPRTGRRFRRDAARSKPAARMRESPLSPGASAHAGGQKGRGSEAARAPTSPSWTHGRRRGRTCVTCARNSAAAGSAGSSPPTAAVCARRTPRPGGTRGRSAGRPAAARPAPPGRLGDRRECGRGRRRARGAAGTTCGSEQGAVCHQPSVAATPGPAGLDGWWPADGVPPTQA